ncbi:hypothetical protein ACFXDI_42420 [Streptomyces mirabilis]|uniref:hypothetical protein n=1 Tax=Streptomyces TaxID=1883 RepID=UPI0036CEFB97
MATQLLEKWAATWPDWEVDRVQAAMVLDAAGNVERLSALLKVAYADYRDVLVATGFADEDWCERMNAELGPE